MEQQEATHPFLKPLLLNGLFIANIVMAIALANAHARDGYLGGLGFIVYASASVFVSAGINFVAFIAALANGNRGTAIIYGVGAFLFGLGAAWAMAAFAHMGNLKPGG